MNGDEVTTNIAKRVWLCVLVCLGMLVVSSISTRPLRAQKPEAERKVLHKVSPRYPQDLKKNGIGGIVRLSLEVSPGGNVEKITVIGGNAALVDAATEAVKQWKYVPSESRSNLEVQFDFLPSQQ